MILLRDKADSRFFLAPDAAALGSGDLELESMTGARARVDGELAARYEVPEAVARAWAEDHARALEEFASRAREHLDELRADSQAQIAELARKAGMDPAKLLPLLGIDPEASAEKQLTALLDLARTLGTEIPDGAGALADAASRLAAVDRAVGDTGEGGQRAVDLLESLAEDPDVDDALRNELAELEALARQLDEP